MCTVTRVQYTSPEKDIDLIQMLVNLIDLGIAGAKPRVKFFSHSRHIHIHDTFKIHSQYIHDTFTIHSWYIHNTFKAHSNYIHEHSNIFKLHINTFNHNTFKLHLKTFTVPQNSLDLYYCHTRAQLTIPDHLIHHLRWSAGATSGTIFYLIRPASRRNSFRLVWSLNLT